MAPFTHFNPNGSRFSDGTYGVYYAGKNFATAVAESAYHFGRIAGDSGDGLRREAMRVVVGRVDATYHDIESLDSSRRTDLLNPSSYAHSQPFAAGLRDAGSNGVHYPSVRYPSGYCIAAFRPTAVGIPRQDRHLEYEWDGQRVRRYFDYTDDQWVDPQGP
jgi:hypothetical protein